MSRISIADADFKYDPEDPDGFRAGMFRPGPDLGAQDSGATVYELPPGQAVCPYHFEYAEEEWLLVLDGQPSLRTPEGTEQLAPGDLAFFPTGPEGAHQIRNDSRETARVIMWSTVVYPAVTEYPDSGKVGVYLRDRSHNLIAPRSANVGYYEGEVSRGA